MKNSAMDELDLEGLTELDIRHGDYTQEDIEAGFAAACTDVDYCVSQAMHSIWYSRIDMTVGDMSGKIKDIQYEILAYIFGTRSRSELTVALRSRPVCDPEIGRRLVDYAREYGFVAELPDDLQKGVS